MEPRPQIGFGSIRHSRQRPAKHGFAYRGYFLRVPLRAEVGDGGGSRWLKRNGRGVFALNDADHGDGRPLLAWARHMLTRAGVHDAHGEIWLHTFPRVLGYLFNPVSFWFAHRADGRLRAVLAEVNNTFGERHVYVLAHGDGRPIAWGEELTASKVFHVSPFCKVEGRYRFRFMLAGSPGAQRFVGRIDYDDAQGALIATSIEGRLEPLTDAALRRAFFAHPVYTFGVVARIHWQALRLFAKRVPFFTKPAPPALDLTRSSPR